MRCPCLLCSPCACTSEQVQHDPKLIVALEKQHEQHLDLEDSQPSVPVSLSYLMDPEYSQPSVPVSLS